MTYSETKPHDSGLQVLRAGGSAAVDTMVASATLTVQELYQGQERQFDVLIGPHALKLGRTAEGGPQGPNDIVLRAPFVARDHARIEPAGLGHRVIDLGAPNRLTLHGRPLEAEPYVLHDGDVLELRLMGSDDIVTLTYRNPLLRAAEQAPQFKSYQLNPKQTRAALGRHDCAVVLDHPTVSRIHAWIDRLPDGSHALRDAGSSNGTFVNGQRISQQLLQAGDIIQIGPFRLIYQRDRLDQYDQHRGMRIDVRDLTYTVTAGGRRQTILQPVSLSIAPREFVAIVGGSGAGKSTLMRALSGRTRPTDGQVLVNGDDFYRHFDAYRALLGYVPQDDILHQILPVDRALGYAARLRLSSDSDAAEIQQRVEQALADVEMLPHRAKHVERLSGGQRKRVSIAAELLADPGLFFLDEPTSGLDPGLERRMMQTLRQLADGGRTVVLVTHATENIALCDQVVFMAGGRMVFFGPPAEALTFFGITSGLFSDIYIRLEGRANPLDPLIQTELSEAYSLWQQQHAQRGELPTMAELWELKYRRSPTYQQYVADRLARSSALPSAQPAAKAAVPPRPPRRSVLRQFALLTRRYLELIARDRARTLLLLLQAPLIALMYILVMQSDVLIGAVADGLVPRIEVQSLLFMLGTFPIWFGLNNTASEIVKEWAIYRRERLANLGLLPYIFSKVTVLGALVAIQDAALLGVLALHVDFAGLRGVFYPLWPEMYASMVLASLGGMAIGLAVSTLVTNTEQATTVVPLIVIPQLLFTGLIFHIEPDTLPNLLSLSMIGRWNVDALGTSVNVNRFCHLPNGFPLAGDCNPPLAEAFPDAFIRSSEHLTSAWAILFLFIVVGIAAAMLTLKLKDRQN